MKFKTTEEAIEQANNTFYGLASGICCNDLAQVAITQKPNSSFSCQLLRHQLLAARKLPSYQLLNTTQHALWSCFRHLLQRSRADPPTYAHTHTHTLAHIHTYIHVHTYKHTRARTHIHVHTHIHARIHTYKHTHIHTDTHTHTYTHAHTHTQTRTYTHTHTYTRMYTCTHAHAPQHQKLLISIWDGYGQ